MSERPPQEQTNGPARVIGPTQTAWATALATFKGRAAAATAILAAATAIADQLFSLTARLRVPAGWAAAALVLLAAAAAIQFAVVVGQSRRRLTGVVTSVFIGAEPFSEREKDRFFGRKSEEDEITRKLRDRAVRFFVLYGQSGCGKTSLIRAGLMPALRGEGLACVYVRLVGHPIRALHDALQKIAPDVVAGDDLEAHLHAAAAAAGKRAVFFIDQFEEFFTSAVSAEERLRVLRFIGACVAGEARNFPQLVFAVRRDFFDLLTEVEPYVGAVFDPAHRRRIDPFTPATARAVIQMSLQCDGATWTADLIDRVLDDLQIEMRDSAFSDPIVIPAELQIVCQMIQRRGWSDRRQYPGKERLIRDYVGDAIEATSRPELAKRVLLALIHENGLTKAEPLTPAAVAARAGGVIDADVAARLLASLDRSSRLVNEVPLFDETGRVTGVAYELAHEYLVDVINNLSGLVMDRTRRANVLLKEYRSRAVYKPDLVVPIADVIRISRDATEAITPADRQLLRRSKRMFAARAVAVWVLPVLLIAALRFGTLHAGPHEYLELRRGLPFLHPLLGSEEVVVAIPIARVDYTDGVLTDLLAGNVLWGMARSRCCGAAASERYIGRLRRILGEPEIDFVPQYTDTPRDAATKLAGLAELRTDGARVLLDKLRRGDISTAPDGSLWALAVAGTPRDDVRAALRVALTSEQRETRELAAVSLAYLGDVDERVKPVLENLDPRCRRTRGVDETEIDLYDTDFSFAPPLELPFRLEPFKRGDVPAWLLTALKNAFTRRGSPLKRQCGADELLRLGARDYVRAELPAMFAEPDTELRLFAADRMLSIEPQHAVAVAVLRQVVAGALTTWQPGVDEDRRYAAIGAQAASSAKRDFHGAARVAITRRISDPELESLMASAVDDPSLAWAALRALAAGGSRDRRFIESLRRRLASADHQEALTAARLLLQAEVDVDRVRLRAAPLLIAPQEWLRWDAAEVLLAAGDTSSGVIKEALNGLANADSDNERERVLAVLRNAGIDKQKLISALLVHVDSYRATATDIRHLQELGFDLSTRMAVLRETAARHSLFFGGIHSAYSALLLREGEPFDDTVRRLTAELTSADGARSDGIRYAVLMAFERLAARGTPAERQRLVDVVAELRRHPALHIRLAAAEMRRVVEPSGIPYVPYWQRYDS